MTVVEDATRVIENYAIVTNVNGVTGTVNANLQCNITGNQANCVEAASGTIGGNAAAVNVATTEAAQQTVIDIDNASGGSAPTTMTAADGIPSDYHYSRFTNVNVNINDEINSYECTFITVVHSYHFSHAARSLHVPVTIFYSPSKSMWIYAS